MVMPTTGYNGHFLKNHTNILVYFTEKLLEFLFAE